MARPNASTICGTTLGIDVIADSTAESAWPGDGMWSAAVSSGVSFAVMSGAAWQSFLRCLWLISGGFEVVALGCAVLGLGPLEHC
jgi:hypothetical protein